jgi:phage tail sheath protein FI
MPSALTYPGVYVEEIPSGVRTITGVATAIAAFVGRAPLGPIDDPTLITSFADFERRFGGLSRDYPMSYAVKDFYLNGGQQAVIVRVFTGDSAAGTATFDVNGLMLVASSPGTWANNALRVRVDQTNIPGPAGNRFNLTVHNRTTGVTETYLGVTTDDTNMRVDRVLANAGSMVRYNPPAVFTPPTLPTAFHANITPAANDVWNDNTLSESPQTLATSDGGALWGTDEGSELNKTGIYALEKTDLFNILCLTGTDRDTDVPPAIYQKALAYCRKRRALLVVDAPRDWHDANAVAASSFAQLTALNLSGDAARNAALYYPRILEADPQMNNQIAAFPPAGAVAGVMARTDVTRGVWKAPAGIDAALNGSAGLSVQLTDEENGLLNPAGINCLRNFAIIGSVVWGARTMRGADLLADEYKYVPVRRLALFLEESLYRGLKWAVFEPNDEPLWAQIRLNAGAFMHTLFVQGAFQGGSPRDAYFVKCDKDTTTQNDINLGIVNVIVGFAPLKPAEFVVLKIQQIAGAIQS